MFVGLTQVGCDHLGRNQDVLKMISGLLSCSVLYKWLKLNLTTRSCLQTNIPVDEEIK